MSCSPPLPISASLLKDERGAVLPMIGLMLMALLILSGLAIDTGRAALVQAKLSSALDAAGLAAGASASTADLTAEATKYMNANFPPDYLGAQLGRLTVTPNSDHTVIGLSAQAVLPTTLMRLAGFREVTVRADSEITRANKGLELVMALDNTGSMAGTPLSDLKLAAKDLIDILYGDKTTVPNLWIGLVPFSQAVNIGSSRTGWLNASHYSGLNWGSTSWAGCVDARDSGRDVTDDPPAVQRFLAYYWPDHASYNNWITSSNRYDYSGGKGPNKNCPKAVTPQTASRATLTNAINAMNAVGNTHVNLGAVWAWRMLSPRWRGLWGGEMNSNALPLDYNTPLMNKAVILMTDGENTMSNDVRSAYGYLSDGRLGTTSSGTAVSRLNSRLTTVCNAMKAQNILVYTIAFRNPGTTIQNLLRSCATSPDYYFNSPNGQELRLAFRTIGDSLANLRISK